MTLYSSPLGAAYAVTLPVYQGPLDLLLSLIEKHELEISAISLVAVTDQYLRTLESLEEVDPGALADFLVVASRLVYIKSRSLLPQPRQIEEEDEEEPADALVRQLLDYRKFKEAAGELRQREEAGLRAFARTAPAPELERRLEPGDLTIEHLHKALRKLLERIPKEAPLPRVKTYAITVAEQIDYVRSIVRRTAATAGAAAPLRFTELLSAATSRLEVIVTFLALLELIKQQELHVKQDSTFGEILLFAADSNPGSATGTPTA